MKECVQTTFTDLFEHIPVLNTNEVYSLPQYPIIKHDSLFYVVNKIGEYPFLNIPLFNQSINHLYLVSPCKAAFIPVAISVAFTALSKNESI